MSMNKSTLEEIHEVVLREFRRGILRGCTPEQATEWVSTGLMDADMLDLWATALRDEMASLFPDEPGGAA